MYILLAVALIIAAVVCMFVPDPLPMIEEIVLVAGSIFSFVKGISNNKDSDSPQKYIEEAKKQSGAAEQVVPGDDSVYVYKPPKKKSKTPKGYPKYDKNNPDAVYYYKK